MGLARRACALRAIVWIGVCATGIGPWASWAEGSPRQALELVRALHLERELQGISRAAIAGIDGSTRELPANDRLLLRATIAAGFDPEALRRLVQRDLFAHLDPEHAQAALEWLARPETQALLARASLPEEASPRGASRGAATHDSLDRDALLRRFDRARGRAARDQQAATLVLSAMLRVANPLLPQERRYSAREITGLLDAQRARTAVVDLDTDGLRMRYRGVSTRELETALAFLEGPSGRWLRRAVDAALDRALVTAAEATAEQLTLLFGSGRPAVPLRTAEADAR